jgi:hypothetical protein
MRRWWRALGRTDQIALLGVIVALLGVLPTYLVFFEDDKKEPTPVVTTIATSKAVTDETKALTVRIPEDWGHIRARWRPTWRGKRDVGTAIQVGSGPALRADSITFSDPNIVVGASSGLARRLQFSARDESDLASWSLAAVRSSDWSQEGCVLVGERDPAVQGFIGILRTWENCDGLDDSHLFEYVGVSRGGGAVLDIQIFFPPRMSQQLAEDIVESVIVREERLPRGAPFTPPDEVPDLPTPYWLQA